MNETRSRPWWRLHAATWGIGFLVLSALAIANSLSVAQILLFGWSNRLHHGWPIRFAYAEIYWPSDREPSLRLEVRDETYAIFAYGFVANAIVAGAIVSGSIWVTERWLRRTNFRLRIGLKGLLVGIACIASVLAIGKNPYYELREWEYVLGMFAFGILPWGIVAAWIFFFDLFGIAWNRLSSRRSAWKPIDPDSDSTGN